MSNTAEAVLEKALTLSPAERATLAASLIESLDTDTDADASILWGSEIRTRISDLDSGRVESVAWPEVADLLRRRIG
jgi:putative addiction module component (TIGR02574 family)